MKSTEINLFEILFILTALAIINISLILEIGNFFNLNTNLITLKAYSSLGIVLFVTFILSLLEEIRRG